MMQTGGNTAKRAEELLKRYDKNGDGKLDDDERADAKEAMMKEQVEKQVARATALPGGLEQFRTQALEMFDKNRDGRLDDDERVAAQKFAETYMAGAEDLNKRFDKNGNGKIDPEERTAIDAYLAELRALGSGQMRAELLRRFDRMPTARWTRAKWLISRNSFGRESKRLRTNCVATIKTTMACWTTLNGSAPVAQLPNGSTTQLPPRSSPRCCGTTTQRNSSR